MIDKIMECLETIEYGFKDENGFNIYKDQKRWDENFEEFYYLQSPDELKKSQCGTCWEQVELERKLFEDYGYEVKTYFICTYADNGAPCHTFLVYEENNLFYWFEHSWDEYKGIHEYKDLNELLLDVKSNFIKSYEEFKGMTFVTRYDQPPYHLKCSEVYEYMEHQELLRLNKEEYYYVLVNKDKPCTAESLNIECDYPNYIVLFKNMKRADKMITYKVNINDEYLEKRMLDIIDYNDDKLILFDSIDLDDFKRCE